MAAESFRGSESGLFSLNRISEYSQQENGGVESFPKHWMIKSTYIMSQVDGESREIPRV